MRLLARNVTPFSTLLLLIAISAAATMFIPAAQANRLRNAPAGLAKLSSTLLPDAGGETCATAPLLSASFSDSDTTSGHVDDLDPATDTTCPSVGGGAMSTSSGAGPDLVYRFNSPVAGSVTVNVDPTTTADLALYVISPGPCPAGSFATGCIVGNDSGGGGTAEQVTFTATAGVDYFIVVDGSAGSNGPFTIDVAAPQTGGWSAAGSTGTIDEDSTAIASLANFTVGFDTAGAATGTINIRYNVTAVGGLDRFCPATQSSLAVRFRDSDGPGTAVQVLVTIRRTSVTTGGNEVIATFDSNSSGFGADATFHTGVVTFAKDFDFSDNVYWAEAQITRGSAASLANLGSIGLTETSGTPCP